MLSADLLAMLQRFHQLDPQAAHAFLLHRTAVNDAVREDPQLPVGKLGATSVMTVMTFLNALVDDGQTIDPVYDSRQQLAGFQVRERVETDADPHGAIYDFLQAVTLESHPAYVRGRPKVGDRVLLLNAAIMRLRTLRPGDAWRALTAAKTRLGVIAYMDEIPGGYLRVTLGEPPNLTEHYVVVREDELRMHKDDWQARYGQPSPA